MATRPELEKLMQDTRLSADARVVGFHVATKTGRGPAEIPVEELDDILGADPNPKRLRQALGQLQRRGYVERSPGGRGHHDRFTFRAPERAHLNGDSEPDSMATRAHLNTDSTADPSTLNAERPQKGTTYLSRDGTPKPDSTAVTAHLNEPHARDKVVEDGSKEDDAFPPVSPRAEAALRQHHDALAGCRGALRDYLNNRVPEKDQDKYVQAVNTMIQGDASFDWRDENGATIEVARRPDFVAAALNELMVQGGGEKAMKWDPGDFRNLKTKLGILTKPFDAGRRHAGSRKGGGSSASREVDYGEGTKEFDGEWPR